jgi:hypothetical protein
VIVIKLAMLASLSKSIATLRKQIWTSEFSAAGQRTLENVVIDPEVNPLPSPQAFLEVRNLKVQLKSLLEERIQLYGTAPKIKVSPNPLDFGPVPICAPETQLMTVSNMADAGMPPNFQDLWLQFEAHPWTNVAAASPWGAFDFSTTGHVDAATPPAPAISIQDLQLGTCASSDPAFTVMRPNVTTVPAGQSISIAIQFAPKAAGSTNAILTVPSNDPANPALQIQLLGQGTNPPAQISLSPTNVDFGKVSVDSDAKHLIRIANVGCGPLNIIALKVTESDKAGVFSVSSSPLPIAIGPGTATMVTVDFAPIGNTGYTGTLDIESNAQTASVTLKGQGLGNKN